MRAIVVTDDSSSTAIPSIVRFVTSYKGQSSIIIAIYSGPLIVILAGQTYTSCLLTHLPACMLPLIGLALFLHPRCFCLAFTLQA